MLLWLRHLGLKWGLAVGYLALYLAVLLLFPVFIRLILIVALALYVPWIYWTQENSLGLYGQVRPLTQWDVPGYEDFSAKLSGACSDLGLRREPYWTVMESESPNAFALGGRRGVVAFTTAILKQCPPDELLAIAGHELQHLASRDSLPALIGGAWLGILGEVTYQLRRVGVSSGGLVAIVAVVFFHILDIVLRMVSWVARVVLATRSRNQEHLADLAGARITSASTMCAALRRIENLTGKDYTKYPAWSPGWIAQHLRANHPETDVRVSYLEAAAARGEIRA